MTAVSISSIPELPHLPAPASPARELSGMQISTAVRDTQVVQKRAALGEMTGGIAHDFGNILAVIGASLRLAERNLDQPESVRRYLAAAHEAIRRGANLTSQLMAFAKRPALEVCPGDANEFLSSLAPLLRYSAGPLNPIVLDLRPNLPSCLIDRTQFDVAVLNLVNNARDAMSGMGGEIQVTTQLCASQSRSYVRIRVEDHGSGMPPEVLNRVFDPFFTTKGEKGSGIGLPQVHAIMKLVGGYICVTSEVGQGTTVDLMFPADECQGNLSPTS